jgi:myosin heavy subunit
MLDTDSNSVFNLLDEACVVTNDNNGLLNNIRKHLVEKNNEVFPEINKRMTRKAFIIKHTPGEIEYSIEGFRERNIDEVREDLIL